MITEDGIVYDVSISKPNTWYIFRENGLEVEIRIFNKEIEYSHLLTQIEKDFINLKLVNLKWQENNGKM